MTESNRLRLTTVRETTIGVTPGTPRMRTARITGESLAFSPSFVNSEELRSDRMQADPIKTDETNQGGINFELSYPMDNTPFSDLLRSALFNTWANTPALENDGVADSVITQVTDSSDTFAVAAGGAAFVAGHLMRTTGFTAANNNGLFRVASSTGTTVVVDTATLTDEAAPPGTARMKVVGFQGAAGDVTATATGLGSTALNFTTLGLSVGQWIKIGGTGTAFRFDTAALNGWARITAITATALTLDNRPSGWTTDAGSGKTIRAFFGDVIKNGVTRTSLTVERGFLGQTVPTYIIQRGMVAGQMDLAIATQQLISGSFTLMGLTGEQATTTLDASPDAAPTNAVMSANVNVGRIGEGGATVAGPNFVRSLNLSVNNNLRMISAVGTVGAVDIQSGTCDVTGTVETYFGDNALLAKLLAGTVGAINARVAKDSQAIVVDIPRVTFTGGSPSAGGRNQDVLLPLQFTASIDSATNAQILLNRVEYFEA